jgi:hypothetical protein
VEVLLIGDEPGMKEVVKDLDVQQIPEVERNELGTPLINSIFNLAKEHSTAGIMMYLNADIILLPECLAVIDSIQAQYEEFLLVGQRWELDVRNELEFDIDLYNILKDRLTREGLLRTFRAIDYFIFPRQLYTNIPPFAVGRAGWDNWMIYHAVHQPWPVIDITAANRVIHQNHNYSHLPNGSVHFDLEESNQNKNLAGWIKSTYDLLDVSLIYRNGKVLNRNFSFRLGLRKLERFFMPSIQQGLRWQLTRGLRKLGLRLDRKK